MANPKNCFNCKEEILETTNYCPNCGQKVDNNNLTLKAVFTEFYENYLSFDTRMGRSIFPFLFQPGKLTKEFVDGKRVSFVNPFRFYLIISILFFSLVGYIIEKQIEDAKKELAEVSKLKNKDIASHSPSDSLIAGIGAFTDSVNFSIDSALVQQELDSLLEAKGLSGSISVERSKSRKEKLDEELIEVNRNGLNFNINTNKLSLIKEYRYDSKYTNEQLLDSLGASNLGSFERYVALQSIKMYRSDGKVITRFVLGNFSIAMFVLIPSLALIFLFMFYRKKMPYVVHLIHSLQLHTFGFFIYSLGLITVYYTDYTKILWLSFSLSAIYMFFSFKRVYRKGFWGTFFRLSISGVLYYLVWITTLSLGLIISFLLF